MIKLKNPFKRHPIVVTHVHDLAEMPCDMGRKIYRTCRAKDCDFHETIPAPAADRLAMAPLAAALRNLQGDILDDVEREIQDRP